MRRLHNWTGFHPKQLSSLGRVHREYQACLVIHNSAHQIAKEIGDRVFGWHFRWETCSMQRASSIGRDIEYLMVC